MNRNTLLLSLRSHLEASDLLGVNVAFASSETGWEAIAIAAGFADWERTQPLDPEQRFPIFSISKTYLATLTLFLQEQGKLTLKQTLDRWLPQLENSSAISLEHLLRHTSGLPDYTGQSAYQEAVRENPSQPWNSTQILECALLAKPHFQPGEGWRYCNTGYWLLGEILERVSQQPLAELVEQTILEPLGLHRTEYPRQLPQQLAPGWSRELSLERSPLDVSKYYHPGWAGPAGAIVSTASEVLAFFRALLVEQRIVQAASLEQLVHWSATGYRHPQGFEVGYGLGIGCEGETPLGTLIGHSGHGPGYASVVRYLQDSKAIAVLLSNTDEIDPHPCFHEVLKPIISTATASEKS